MIKFAFYVYQFFGNANDKSIEVWTIEILFLCFGRLDLTHLIVRLFISTIQAIKLCKARDY